MRQPNCSDGSKSDAVAQITERGCRVPLALLGGSFVPCCSGYLRAFLCMPYRLRCLRAFVFPTARAACGRAPRGVIVHGQRWA